jgi:hypothetical protein
LASTSTRLPDESVLIRAEARATTVVLACLLGACAPEVERTPVGPGTDTTGGGPPRATLTVVPQFALRDSAIVRLLGGSAQAAAGAEVRLQRSGSSAVVTGALDDTGGFVSSDLLEGSYQISIRRVLTAAERERLAVVAPDADAFVAAAEITVSAQRTERRPTASFGRRGSVIISEINHAEPLAYSGSQFYSNGHFVELYNNGDTTIYLDGLTIALGFGASYDYPNFPCTLYAPLTLDTLGIWSRYMWRMPGDGQQYPLAPGQAAVFASDAIDHTPFAPGAANLSGATFEATGTGGVDNPAVPNAVQFGPSTYPSGGGFVMFTTVKVVVLATRLELAGLTQQGQPGAEDVTLAGIPAASILDVVTNRPAIGSEYGACPGPLAQRFERQGATLLDGTDARTLQRRVLYNRNDGRRVLQRTGASAADFDARAATPGALP